MPLALGLRHFLLNHVFHDRSEGRSHRQFLTSRQTLPDAFGFLSGKIKRNGRSSLAVSAKSYLGTLAVSLIDEEPLLRAARPDT